MARGVVPIRLDPDEIARLDAAAQRHGVTRTSFIRTAALAAAVEPDTVGRPRGQRSRPAIGSALCRHHLTDCRVCHTGRYAG